MYCTNFLEKNFLGKYISPSNVWEAWVVSHACYWDFPNMVPGGCWASHFAADADPDPKLILWVSSTCGKLLRLFSPVPV